MLNFSRFVIDLCFLSVYSLVDSSVGDHQHRGPGGHQDQRGLGPRVSESCARKQVRIVINRFMFFLGLPSIFNRLFNSLTLYRIDMKIKPIIGNGEVWC